MSIKCTINGTKGSLCINYLTLEISKQYNMILLILFCIIKKNTCSHVFFHFYNSLFSSSIYRYKCPTVIMEIYTHTCAVTCRRYHVVVNSVTHNLYAPAPCGQNLYNVCKFQVVYSLQWPKK